MRLEGLVAEASLRDLDLLVDITGDPSTEVDSITIDSRQVGPGALFACVPGQVYDGHLFAASAVAGGASAVLCERPLDVDAPQLLVSSVRRALGPLSDALFGHPSRHLTVCAVTGTNGKTTTCAFLCGIFDANGWPSVSIGTLSQRRTTPEAPDLQALLSDWRERGGAAVAMEVSSHALDQHRVDATHFAAGIFTNLTREHLDYHRTMDAYFEAKATLFEAGRLDVAVVHRGDPWGRKLIDRLHSPHGRPSVPVESFGVDDAVGLELSADGSTFEWDGHRVGINVGGRFNVLNAVAAARCARALGIDTETIVEGLAAVKAVPGRFQVVDAEQPFTVIVDYAHTPDGIAQVLDSARELTRGRLIVVFGAGGERDHDKRPLMGEAAADRADLVVITSDNPRSEDPDSIIDAIVAGVVGRPNVIREPDREAAIAAALANAGPGDVVVIAGKGHERGQEIAGRVVAFDDTQVARSALERILSLRREPT